ncbi:hypothetical protein U3516DRAFT_739894 [Neocallimastix sp. 'constans']
MNLKQLKRIYGKQQKILIDIVTDNIVDEKGQSPLIAKVNCRDKECRNVMMLSCFENGTVGIVHCLIKYGAEVNA